VNFTLAFPLNDSKEISAIHEEKKIPEYYNYPNYHNFHNNGIPPYNNVDFKSDSNDKDYNKSKSYYDTGKLDNIKANISEKGKNSNIVDDENTSHSVKEMSSTNNNDNNNTNNNNNNNDSKTKSKDLNDDSLLYTSNTNPPNSINYKNTSINTEKNDINNERNNSSKGINPLNNNINNNELNDTSTENNLDTTLNFVYDTEENKDLNKVEYTIDNSSINEKNIENSKTRRVIYVSGVLMGVALFFIIGIFIKRVNNISKNSEIKNNRTLSLDLESIDSIQLRAGDLDSLLSLETMEQYSKNSQAYVIDDDNNKKNIAKIYEIKGFKDNIFRRPSDIFKNDYLFDISNNESLSFNSLPSFDNNNKFI